MKLYELTPEEITIEEDEQAALECMGQNGNHI